ncbi:hypothetical protein BE20_02290 [Sorangium cellulosum]|uniref:Uncharacterized protein n=1 Tax=Sorangium cellulosum TaxID=56 RepID=A0A150SCP8_SORCE|nr:hypothetical protein BE18_18765 [Sorangium cellulosum]KYF89918.1 hypothetical protein BE20_02290 [Sorangium cellulosum]
MLRPFALRSGRGRRALRGRQLVTEELEAPHDGPRPARRSAGAPTRRGPSQSTTGDERPVANTVNSLLMQTLTIDERP